MGYFFMRVLVLGGTAQANLLCQNLALRSDIVPVLSLAGRTQNPAVPAMALRSGGFGGIAGLCAYLVQHAIAAVIDATHPFASQMSAHACAACAATGIPLAVFTRPSWQQQAGDMWLEVDTVAQVVAALGPSPRRIFLTHGRLQLQVFGQAPQHFYLVRSIEPPDNLASLPRHRLILARGPFALADEERLMRTEKIDALVTKNSGGSATYAKIEAARNLGIEVVMLRRPPASAATTFTSLPEVLAWLDSHGAAP